MNTFEKGKKCSFLTDLNDKIKEIERDSSLLSATHQREVLLSSELESIKLELLRLKSEQPSVHSLQGQIDILSN